MMKKTSMVLAGVAAAVLAGTAGTAMAQMANPDLQPGPIKKVAASKYGSSQAKYRPLTVQQAPAPAPAPAADPFGAGLIGGAIGTGVGVAGSAVSGVGGLVAAPLQALGGGPVGISPIAAPPLPIKARYAHTGKVFSSYDEGYAQDVPVDASGPIYQIDGSATRTVTPFTLAAFPVAGLASAITTPLRPAAP